MTIEATTTPGNPKRPALCEIPAMPMAAKIARATIGIVKY
jgi:hypothetical protein